MTTRLIHPAKLDEAVKIAKLLGNKTRIQILYLLEQQQFNVTELQEILHVEQSSLSHQLKELRDYQLISQQRVGKSVYYQLTDPHILATMDAILAHTDHVLQGRAHDGQPVDVDQEI
ncbi:ArsR/SmtB family transcription factor [Levilactobacillus bambusae]|uniref:ArsR family transcriptional regulator n=1 Tax=Levilactobacillus bambusae TaxID=2024736 RepID=A0A2V1MZN8_9LACO|nr:metalloregulator ArsR/SmtB family transcription factor [Levilactobacillus bambusae]PWG00447.1 ArsR family transcriptional regulator [Levilactobacillus bambusae]